MIVYAFDNEFPWPHCPASGHRAGDVVATEVLESDTVLKTVELIKNSVRFLNQGERSIWLLRLCCHGNAGVMWLGEGVRARNAHQFRGLADWMTPGGRGVEIHGCGVGSDDSILQDALPICRRGSFGSPTGLGRIFLLKLAAAFGVPVTGAINCQRSDRLFRFEGPTVTAYPDGGIRRPW